MSAQDFDAAPVCLQTLADRAGRQVIVMPRP